MKPMLEPPITKRLKLKRDVLLSNFALKFNLRRYTKGRGWLLTTLALQSAAASCLGLSAGAYTRFPFPLNLSLLCPFPLDLSLLCPQLTHIDPWVCPEGAQVEV